MTALANCAAGCDGPPADLERVAWLFGLVALAYLVGWLFSRPRR